MNKRIKRELKIEKMGNRSRVGANVKITIMIRKNFQGTVLKKAPGWLLLIKENFISGSSNSLAKLLIYSLVARRFTFLAIAFVKHEFYFFPYFNRASFNQTEIDVVLWEYKLLLKTLVRPKKTA